MDIRLARLAGDRQQSDLAIINFIALTNFITVLADVAVPYPIELLLVCMQFYQDLERKQCPEVERTEFHSVLNMHFPTPPYLSGHL